MIGIFGSYEVVSEFYSGVTSGSIRTVEAPAGKKVISGGVNTNGGGTILSSYPEEDGTAWNVSINAGSPISITVYAVCADVS